MKIRTIVEAAEGVRRLGGFPVTVLNIQDQQSGLNEFAADGGDDREPDQDEILRRLAAKWWNGTEQQMVNAERTLTAMGWEIGQDESGDDDAGVFVVRVGDDDGSSYIAFPHSELELNEAIKLNAPQRVIPRGDLQGYAGRIKTGTKTKQDRFSPIVHGSNIKAITKDDGGTEWDLDDLAAQITQRPRTILGTNAKMEKSANEGEIVYDLTLPALSGIVVDEESGDFVEITTCPGAGGCQLFCYARKGGYVMFPASSMSAAQALNFLVNDPAGYTAMVNKEIQQIKGKTDKRGIQLVVRWHDAGDFFSKEYLELAYGVARANPDVKFYAYTKMADVATGDKPPNFIINFSSGAKRAQDKKIEIHKAGGAAVKQGLTLPKDMFRGLFVTDAKGKYVKDEQGRTQVKGEAEWNQFKQNLAAKYNIDPDTIVTYDQMLKIPEGPKPKWNVIVFPAGHGDRAANRLDVENSFLMFH